MTKTVTIIGAGFSGSLTALNILELSGGRGVEVILVDPRGTFGPGLAYTVPSDRFKLNVRAKAMGAFPSAPDGFLKWLSERDPSSCGESFVSRRLYGAYLEQLVTDAAKRHPQALRLVSDEVVDVRRSSSGQPFSLTLANGESIEADICVLAIGNVLRKGVGACSTRSLLREPYRTESYNDLGEIKELFILGSSLTAVDAILESEGRGFRGHYSVISRNGRFPLPHEDPSKLPQASLPAAWETPESALALLKTIRKASRACGSSQPVFDAMRPGIQRMWLNLPISERRAFLRHLRSFWEIHRHRIPLDHLRVIQTLQDAGRLSIRAGRVVQIAQSEAVIAPRGAQSARETIHFDVGFMCAGPEGDVTRIEHPLIESLLAQELIRPGKLALGLDTSGASSEPHFFVVGPLQKEALWEVTAVRELREQAQQVASRINTATN